MADKKLAKKLAKMSEEERTIFLEQQRLAEEESQKKKEEDLFGVLKTRLQKEEKALKLSLLKLQNQWRTIMRMLKSEELQKDVEIMSHTFERRVDRKDAIIRSLAKDLEEAEEQYQVALRTHLKKTDSLIEFQAKKMRELEEDYEQELAALQLEFDRERQTIIQEHEKQIKDLHDIMYAMELRFSERETEAKHEFESLIDEIKNKHLEDTHALSAQRKGVLDDLWKEFQKETQQYKESTEEKKLRFEALKKKDEESAKTIARQMKKLQKLQDSIAALKQKMSANTRESEEKIKTIKEDREAILSQSQQLKQEMNKAREMERSCLVTLTLQTDAAIKDLMSKEEKSQKILTIAEMCRKLETEEEKVLPFYASSLTAEEEQTATCSTETPTEGFTQVMHDYTALENFWKRYNKVMLEKVALDKEKESLDEENKRLKMLLKQYLDGISVSDEVLSQRNPLLVVNQRASNTQMTVPVGDPRVQRQRVCVVEAALAVKNISC
ncbi:hypothetical protein EMCRGX_G024571 [Ephydatia muelleri]|eukprot:Em0015g733a